jgi:hypothetical protein
VGIGEPTTQTICLDSCETESGRPQDNPANVFPRNLGKEMTYSDPTHRLLNRIGNELERIANYLERQEQKPKTTRKKNPEKELLPTYSPGFEAWWKLYPRKVQKETAWKSWKKICTDNGKEVMLIADMKLRAEAWKDTELKFIPHGSTFLNRKGWKDPIEQAIPQTKQEPKTEQEWLTLAHEKGINTVGLTLHQLKDRVRTS